MPLAALRTTLHYTCSRATTFFRICMAHAWLNGLVKGFWKLAGRDKQTNEKLTCGQEVVLSKESKAKIAANVAAMSPTSAFTSTFKDILTCAPCRRSECGLGGGQACTRQRQLQLGPTRLGVGADIASRSASTEPHSRSNL